VKLSALGIFLVVAITFVIADVWNLHQNYDSRIHNYQRYWPTHIILQDAWWNRATSIVPLYRTDRFGRPAEVFNLQWAGSLKEIKNTLRMHGWKSFHTRGYLGLILQLLQQTEFAKQRPLMTQLFDARPPVLGMIHYYAPGKPPLVLRLWQTNILLLPGKTPLWIGTVGYHVVSKHFIFLHKSEMIPETSETEHIIRSLSGYVWCAKRVSFEEVPEKLRKHVGYFRVLLIGKCASR
jgi:uncharacterized protein YcgL (UPF0745 family)